MTDPQTIAPTGETKRGRSELRFPVYDLGDCVAVAKVIHEKGGGMATNDHLAAYLGYKSANNGAFLSRVAGSKMFGLIAGAPSRLTLTTRAQKILMPVRDTDPREALVEAFMAIPLYKAIYTEYHGKELPPEFGLKNAMRTMFGVTPQRIDRAYRAFIDSAEIAGFFDVRGSRTQLILPALPTLSTPPPPDNGDELPDDEERVVGGGGGNDGEPPNRRSSSSLRDEYVSTLIALLKERSSDGEIDTDLMQRIERLLDLPQ